MSTTAPRYDFRSDTVTHPTPSMYRALAEAPLGDDVFEDDPTVRALEERVADLFGKGSALFMPSGTMANSVAIALATRPGDEVLMLEDSHTFLFEVAGAARLWGVQSHPIAGVDACLTPEQIDRAVRPDDPHEPRTSLVCVENTHNMQGGRVIAPERISAVADACDRHGLRLHIDGARIFNAAAATGRPVAEITAHANSVSFCLSKGLSCPVGSMLVTAAEERREAIRLRKVLGGALRQVGILAACGAVALDEVVPRLADDHARAQRLGAGLRELPGARVWPWPVESNIVMLSIEGAAPADYDRLVEAVEGDGVLSMALFGRQIRLVTHRGLGDEAIDAALEAFSKHFPRYT